ncbi:MAG: D-Ala-D-Ala carboxypeptidase family metallohydrolase [Nitrospirales bacterium]
MGETTGLMGDLSKHFDRAELECKCGCGEMKFTLEAIECLEDLRQEYGVPMRISSGYRCPTHNDAVSSTGLTGPHTIWVLDNVTVDVLEFGPNVYDLVEAAIAYQFTGIGLSQKDEISKRFIHLDRLPTTVERPRPTIWTY